MQKNKTIIEHEISIPLPENLPSSFFYCGEKEASQISVVYELKASLLGVIPQNAGLLDEPVVVNKTQIVRIRARDPPNKQGGITQEITG